MSKKIFIKTLNQMAKVFKNSKNVLEAIDFLLEACNSLEENEEKFDCGLEFPLPAESLKKKNAISVFTDGACRNNPGPGAWALMAQDSQGNIIFQSSGLDVATTNNKMELSAVIEALKSTLEYFTKHNLNKSTPVILYSDSKYVLDGLKSWVEGWKKRGWRKADNKVPENIELWQELDDLRNQLNNFDLVWVKGHSGHPQNEQCDRLANQELDNNGF